MLSFSPPDVLDDIWDLIESVSEGFLTYFHSFHNKSPVDTTEENTVIFIV